MFSLTSKSSLGLVYGIRKEGCVLVQAACTSTFRSRSSGTPVSPWGGSGSVGTPSPGCGIISLSLAGGGRRGTLPQSEQSVPRAQ